MRVVNETEKQNEDGETTFTCASVITARWTQCDQSSLTKTLRKNDTIGDIFDFSNASQDISQQK